MKPFQFKQFAVNQDRCAMKIGTDGVLLGAWASIRKHPFSVLDIGAGTGVISLMLAQRSQAQLIDAIEIDADAYEQCTENFENSPWNDRLFCYHASIVEFVEEIEDKYDLIISNPPFYAEDYKTEDRSRDLARFADAMPFDILLYSVANLLSEEGIFSVIIPFHEKESFIDLATQFGLYTSRVTDVRGTPSSEFKRSLLEFSFQKVEVSTSELTIELSRHNYTEAYTELTRDFYLKM